MAIQSLQVRVYDIFIWDHWLTVKRGMKHGKATAQYSISWSLSLVATMRCCKTTTSHKALTNISVFSHSLVSNNNRVEHRVQKSKKKKRKEKLHGAILLVCCE